MKRPRVRLVYFFFLVMVLQIITANNMVNGQPNYVKKTFNNDVLGLQFQYPAQWGEPLSPDIVDCKKSACPITFEIRDPNSIDLFIIRIDTYSLNVLADNSCNCKSLMDFVSWDYDRTFETDNKIINQNQTRVNHGHDAWEMELSSIEDKGETRKLVVWTTDGNTGYRIQYSSPTYRFTEYLPAVDDMIQSFIFAKQNVVRQPACLLFNLICI